MPECTFSWSVREDTTLPAALPAAAPLLCVGGHVPVAMIYTPERCGLGRLHDDGTLTGPRGEAFALARAFEARVFSPAGELRWLRSGPGAGRAVLLVDGPPAPESEAARKWRGTWILERALVSQEQHYLLWGTASASGQPGPATGLASGWSRLIEARIGALEVPLSLPPGSRARLRVREYFADLGDGHGNVALLEERLLELVPYPVPGAIPPAAVTGPEVGHG